MVKSHVIKLNPTPAQVTFFKKSSGVARFAYNWALDKWNTDYNQGVRQSAYALVKHLNSIKKTEFPWMQETGKTCSQYAIHNVEKAFKKMWKEQKGHPVFKKKGRKDSFVAVENSMGFKQLGKKIWIPRLGWVKSCEEVRFTGKINYLVVKRIADLWFAVVNIDVDINEIDLPITNENQVTIGIDMGIKSMMVLSDGTIYENPKALKSNLKSVKRIQRGLSRKQKGSNNRGRQQIKLAKKYYRISCIRKNAIHQATSQIVDKYDKIIIETLTPKTLLKNRKLSQSISDVSFGEIARQLSYKAKWQGKELVKADQWFASSKTCSKCGNKKESLSLSVRVYRCNVCELTVDRDLNAAINLANYSPTSKSEGSKASGVPSPSSEKRKRGTMKDEIKTLSHQHAQSPALS